MIVAVDGPAGSGKSSVCAKVSEQVGFTYINTGFLYRAVGVLAREAGIPLAYSAALSVLIDDLVREAEWRHDSATLWFRGRNLTPELGSVAAGNDASLVAKVPDVRSRLIPLQRRLTEDAPRGALVDGRDIGTVVFPDADLKVYMTASLDERARRRLEQLAVAQKNDDSAFERIKEDIARRDEQDKARGVSPLKQAEDAVLFDTSEMDVETAVRSLIELMRDRNLI